MLLRTFFFQWQWRLIRLKVGKLLLSLKQNEFIFLLRMKKGLSEITLVRSANIFGFFTVHLAHYMWTARGESSTETRGTIGVSTRCWFSQVKSGYLELSLASDRLVKHERPVGVSLPIKWNGVPTRLIRDTTTVFAREAPEHDCLVDDFFVIKPFIVR